ncbi:MAG: TRAP transporter small permease subunit, partial [Rhodobacteraceae bacterium]|nr:TRAP transporter small permease subunit [Paracoccaceae bacterium]
MLAAMSFIDRIVRNTLTSFCAILLLLMVAFTVYSVVMRYVFENPPVWGDLLTVLSNIWLVFFALALTVRDKDYIALDLIYSWLPPKVSFCVQQFWSMVIFGLGLVMIIWGIEVVTTMGGKYWEMWYFAWEDGQIVFKPNYMPKKYAVAIVPISGFLEIG